MPAVSTKYTIEIEYRCYYIEGTLDNPDDYAPNDDNPLALSEGENIKNNLTLNDKCYITKVIKKTSLDDDDPDGTEIPPEEFSKMTATENACYVVCFTPNSNCLNQSTALFLSHDKEDGIKRTKYAMAVKPECTFVDKGIVAFGFDNTKLDTYYQMSGAISNNKKTFTLWKIDSNQETSIKINLSDNDGEFSDDTKWCVNNGTIYLYSFYNGIGNFIVYKDGNVTVTVCSFTDTNVNKIAATDDDLYLLLNNNTLSYLSIDKINGSPTKVKEISTEIKDIASIDGGIYAIYNNNFNDAVANVNGSKNEFDALIQATNINKFDAFLGFIKSNNNGIYAYIKATDGSNQYLISSKLDNSAEPNIKATFEQESDFSAIGKVSDLYKDIF